MGGISSLFRVRVKINRTKHDCLDIQNLSLSLEKYFTCSLHPPMKYFSTFKDNFCVSVHGHVISSTYSTDLPYFFCIKKILCIHCQPVWTPNKEQRRKPAYEGETMLERSDTEKV